MFIFYKFEPFSSDSQLIKIARDDPTRFFQTCHGRFGGNPPAKSGGFQRGFQGGTPKTRTLDVKYFHGKIRMEQMVQPPYLITRSKLNSSSDMCPNNEPQLHDSRNMSCLAPLYTSDCGVFMYTRLQAVSKFVEVMKLLASVSMPPFQ